MGGVPVVLVRHGRATAGWDVDPDPGLDDLGVQQASQMAEIVAAAGPWALWSSPLRRTRQTAAAIEALWGTPARIVDEVAEIPSPDGVPMGERVAWLRQAMAGNWADLGPRYTQWRDQVVATVASISEPTVVVSHFIAINAVIGACTGDDRVVIASLDNCSRTEIEVVGGSLRLRSTGHEADTLIR